MADAAPPVPGRNCNACTLCCTVLAVKALNKPPGVDCVHAVSGKGCQIYADRPAACVAFHCEFLLDPKLASHWRPKRSRMVLYYDDEAKRMGVHVDPARPDAWTQAPYYDDLKRWARAAAPIRGQVIVRVGEERIAILPDRDKRLGALDADQVLVSVEYETPVNVIYDVVAMDKNDPRLKQR
jgi:hypothetical protein